MEQEIVDFDPFENIVVCERYNDCYIDSEPMTEYDWEEWLDIE